MVNNLKKILKIAMPLFIIAMIITTTNVRADFSVTVGQTNVYDVVESDWTLVVGANNGGGTGFVQESVGYDLADNITIEVTAETTTSVDYDFTCDIDTYGYSSNGLGNIFYMVFSLMLPLMMPLMVSGTWVQAEVDAGPMLWGEFFIDSVMTEAFYEFANNQTALDEMTNDPDNSEITFKKFTGAFTNATDIAVFDWACDFDIKNTTTTTDWGGKYRWKLAFDQTTGWVKGWRIFMDYAGTFEGTVLEIAWNQLVQQQGYTLGNFAIATGLFPGFEWFLALPALGLLAIPIIIKRRK